MPSPSRSDEGHLSKTTSLSSPSTDKSEVGLCLNLFEIFKLGLRLIKAIYLLALQEAPSPGTNQGSPLSRQHQVWTDEVNDSPPSVLADLVDDVNWSEDIDLGSDLNVAVATRNRLRSRLQAKGLAFSPAPGKCLFRKNNPLIFFSKMVICNYLIFAGAMRLLDLGRKIAELKMEPKIQGQDQTRLGSKPCGPGPKTVLDGNRRDSNSTVSCYGTMSHVSSRRNSQASQVG